MIIYDTRAQARAHTLANREMSTFFKWLFGGEKEMAAINLIKLPSDIGSHHKQIAK